MKKSKFRSKISALRTDRAQVEKLEDRVLLSADPLLQQSRPDESLPLAVDNLVLEVAAPQAGRLDLSGISAYATVIDLSLDGAGAQQDAALSALGADLLSLNRSMSSLVLDLGDSDDQVVLNTTEDGRLRLSGASIRDLVFDKPTSLLGLLGSGGHDRVLLQGVDLGQASLQVEAEQIELPEGALLVGGGDLLLTALASYGGTGAGVESLALSAGVMLDGQVQVAGDVVLKASVQVALEVENALLSIDHLNVDTEAVARVGAQASLQAAGLEVTAYTDNDLVVRGSGALGVIGIGSNQRTEAGVAGGAALLLQPAPDATGVSLLVEAIDRSRLLTSLEGADDLVNQLTGGFELGIGHIELGRETLAYLGDGSARISLDGVEGASAGLVQVSAANVDADAGGVAGEVLSSLMGVQNNTVVDRVLAQVVGVDANVEGLQVYAYSATSQTASAKVARQNATGSTRALLSDSTLVAAGAVDLLALDQSSFEAFSGGFSADIPKLDSVKLGIASASNTVDRSVEALLLDAQVDASALHLVADSAQTLSTETESLAVVEGDSGSAAQAALALGGTFAWNQMLGGVQAHIESSQVDTSAAEADAGEVLVQARNASSLGSVTSAGTSVTGAAGSAGGAALAFNAVGWDMGNVAAASLNALIGSDVGFTSLPLETLAVVRASDVKAGADLSVLAEDGIELAAEISNAAQASSGNSESALSVGAAAVLASNRVRSNTRALIAGADRIEGNLVNAIEAGGSITVNATDSASINASVAMSALAAASGGSSVAVGGIVVRNDLRNEVLASIERVTLLAGADLVVEALSLTAISAELSGEVRAGSDAGPADGEAPVAAPDAVSADDAPGSDQPVAEDQAPAVEPAATEPVAGGGAIAANGLIATNLILSQVEALVRDSVLAVVGDGTVAAENESTLDASNSAVTESSASAVGATLAFNTIGWQSQNLLYGALDALLGSSIGKQRPTTVRAEIAASSFEFGGDLAVTALQVPQINATVDNSVASSGAGAAVSFVLASNLLSSRADALIEPADGTAVQRVGGDLLLKASDTAGIAAEVSMGSSSTGGSAVGGLVARNDVRNAVSALINDARLEVAGDVSIIARGSATITATLSGTTESLPAEEGDADATAAPALAASALIATNLILSNVAATVVDSEVVAGGDFGLLARNASLIEADNSATMSSGGSAVGVTLAFNTIGWQAQNLLFSALDALLGSRIGNEQPAEVLAGATNSRLQAGGDLSLEAEGEAMIASQVVNEVLAEAAGAAASFVLASNLVSSRSRTRVLPGDTDLGLAWLESGAT